MFWSIKSRLKRAIRSAGLRKCKSEADAERRLAEKLRKSGFDVEQQVHKDGQRADLVVHNIPIEIKFQPTGTELDRLVGQIARYKKNWGDVIVVVVKGSKEDYTRLEVYARGTTVIKGG